MWGEGSVKILTWTAGKLFSGRVLSSSHGRLRLIHSSSCKQRSNTTLDSEKHSMRFQVNVLELHGFKIFVPLLLLATVYLLFNFIFDMFTLYHCPGE